MAELFTGFNHSVSLNAWIDEIENTLPGGKSLADLTWKPERKLAVAPVVNSLPPGRDYQSLVGHDSAIMVCDHLRSESTESILDAATHALAQGSSAIEIDAHQLHDLSADISSISGLSVFVVCTERSEWESVMAECRKDGFATANDQVHVFYDPFSAPLNHEKTVTRTELSSLVKTGLELRSKSTGSLWSADVSCNAIQHASFVTRTAYVLAAVSSVFQEIAGQGIEFPSGRSLLRIVWPVGNTFVLEIAALRALRLLIPQILESIFDVPVDGIPVPIHATNYKGNVFDADQKTGTHGRLIACSLQGTVAIISGCQSLCLHLSPGEERTVNADETRRWLRNIPLILKYEGMLHSTTDPLAGAYVVEELTDQVSVQSWKVFLEVEAAGGLETQAGRDIIRAECASDAAVALKGKRG